MKPVPHFRSDCTFCRIIQRDVKAEILFENEDALCILDINPIHFGHSLVIPKQHCTDFVELPTPMIKGVFEAAQSVSRALVRGLNLDGFNVFSNNGRIAGQSVFHFHLHITPRYRDDQIQFVLKLKHYGDGEMERYGALIRSFLSTQS